MLIETPQTPLTLNTGDTKLKVIGSVGNFRIKEFVNEQLIKTHLDDNDEPFETLESVNRRVTGLWVSRRAVLEKVPVQEETETESLEFETGQIKPIIEHNRNKRHRSKIPDDVLEFIDEVGAVLREANPYNRERIESLSVVVREYNILVKTIQGTITDHLNLFVSDKNDKELMMYRVRIKNESYADAWFTLLHGFRSHWWKYCKSQS